MAIARFTEPEEFIEALRGEFCDRATPFIPVTSIIRFTGLTRAPNGLLVQRLYLDVATKARGVTLRLEAYCGEIWRSDIHDRPVWDRAKEIYTQFEKACEDLGLEVRTDINTLIFS